MKKQKYDFKIYNGRIKVYIDGYVAFCFNQIVKATGWQRDGDNIPVNTT